MIKELVLFLILSIMKAEQEFQPPVIPSMLTAEQAREKSINDDFSVDIRLFNERVAELKNYIERNKVNADIIDITTLGQLIEEWQGETYQIPTNVNQNNKFKAEKNILAQAKQLVADWQEIPNMSLINMGTTEGSSRAIVRENQEQYEEIGKIQNDAQRYELCYKDENGKLVRMSIDTSRIPKHENWGFANGASRMEDELNKLGLKRFVPKSGGFWQRPETLQRLLDHLEKKTFGDITT